MEEEEVFSEEQVVVVSLVEGEMEPDLLDLVA